MLQLFVFPFMYCQTIKFGTGHYYDLQGVKKYKYIFKRIQTQPIDKLCTVCKLYNPINARSDG